MSRVRSFFLQEAAGALEVLREELGTGVADPGRAHWAARLLRGSAQMARYGALAVQAGRLEQRLRALARGGDGGVHGAPAQGESAPGERVDTAGLLRTLRQIEAAVAEIAAGRTEPDPRTERSMEGQQVEGDEVVPVEELELTGRRALERALELRTALEDALVSQDPIGPLLDELFDLVRQGMR